MIDLERFTTIPEEASVLWNIWAKIGDTGPDDRGLKDGELTQCYPVEPGVDRYGAIYGGVGSKDLTGYVIFQAIADKATIRNLFKHPAKNSNAFKRNRKTYYYLNLEKHFDAETISEYRDHNKQMDILKGFDLSGLSDYRKTPERLNKPFVHGSEVSGNFTFGGGGADYTDLKTAIDDVGDVAGNTITFECIAANSPGADIDFDKTTTSDGLIRVFSTQYGFINNPKITGGSKWWKLDGRCNLKIEDIWVSDISLHYDTPTSGSPGRTHIFRRMYFEKGINLDPFFPNIEKTATPITIKFYGNLITGAVGAVDATGNWTIIQSTWGSDWNDYIFFENNTFIADYDYTQGAMYVDGSSGSLNFYNNAIYQSTGSISWKETVTNINLFNCARNKATSGTVNETNCITDLVSGDFVDVTIGNPNAGKITTDSRLFAVGVASGNIPEYTRDIVGDNIPTPDPSIGAFQAGAPSPEVFDGNPEVYFENHLEDATLTVTSAEEAFPKEHLTYSALWANWKATSTADQTLTADCGANVIASRLLLSGEFLDLSGAYVKLQYSDDDVIWSTLTGWTQQAEGPVLVRFTETTARYWRVVLTGLTAAPVIGHWGIYDPLVAPREIGEGTDLYKAKDLSLTHTTENGKDQMHKGPQLREGRLLLGNIIHEGAVADKVDELRGKGRTEKIYICLEPDTAPEEVFCALLKNSIFDPVKGQTRSPRLDYREVT